MIEPKGPNRCHALAARRLARYSSRLYDSYLASIGLTISQYSILALIDAHNSFKISELADNLVMERTSLVRALKPLQIAGWILTKRKENSRSLDLSLSSSGRAKVAEALPLWERAQASFELQIGQERAERLRNETLDVEFSLRE